MLTFRPKKSKKNCPTDNIGWFIKSKINFYYFIYNILNHSLSVFIFHYLFSAVNTTSNGGKFASNASPPAANRSWSMMSKKKFQSTLPAVSSSSFKKKKNKDKAIMDNL